MNGTVEIWTRRAVWALPVYGALLAVSTLSQQPDPESDFAAYAAYVTTPTFLLSHLVASIAGAAFGLIGVAALFVLTSDSSPRRAVSGAVLWAFGQVGLVSIFGVAAFAQPAIGRAFIDGDRAVAEAINADAYGDPLTVAAGLSLLSFVAAGILLGGAMRRIPGWARWIGVAFAASITVFAAGLLVDVPFIQPVAGIGVAIAGAAIALEAGSTGRVRAGMPSEGATV
jgi:hypothetical protein